MRIDLAVTLLLTLAQNAGKISALIQQAQAEGRDISEDEWKSITDADDKARAGLAAEIAAA